MTLSPAEDGEEASSPSRRSGTMGRILENAGWLLAGKGVGAVLSLVYLAIVTRSLGAEGFGQFALILAAAQTLGALMGFQTWQIVVRFGMEHLQAGREDKLRDLIGLSLMLDFGGALVGCLVAWASVGLLGDYFEWSEPLRRQALLFALVMLLSIRSTAVGVLRLYDRFRDGAVADAVIPVVRMIGAVVVLLTEPSVLGFLIAWGAAEIAAAAASWWLAARAAGGLMTVRRLPNVRQVFRENPGLGRFAAVTNLNSTLGTMSKQFATVIVGLFAGEVAAGQYRLAYQLGQALAKVSDLLSRAVFAELTRVRFGAASDNLAKLFRSSVRFSAIAAGVIVALLFLLGKPALLLVAGPEFAGAYPLLLLLGAAAALDLAGVSFEPAMLATGKAGLVLKLRLLVTVLLVALLIVLLPPMSTMGAAIATLVASLAGLILFGFAAWRSIHAPAG
jgi:O-antigen/teichoic acid export membrane protein